jgi:hypothetical protein
MNYALTIRKEAEFDIDEHFNFYEEKRDGLGPVAHNQAIKFAPFGRRTLVPCAVYGER